MTSFVVSVIVDEFLCWIGLSFPAKQFVTEVYDKDLTTATRKQGEGGRVRASRKKTEPEKRRVKAAGGGKTAPAKDYKPRKDIGTVRKLFKEYHGL